MFAGLLPQWFTNWLEGLLQRIVQWLLDALKQILSVIQDAVSALLGGLLDLVLWAFPSLESVLTYSNIAKINYFFPLTETVLFLGVYLTLWAGILLYRIIKSLIPTVSGT